MAINKAGRNPLSDMHAGTRHPNMREGLSGLKDQALRRNGARFKSGASSFAPTALRGLRALGALGAPAGEGPRLLTVRGKELTFLRKSTSD